MDGLVMNFDGIVSWMIFVSIILGIGDRKFVDVVL